MQDLDAQSASLAQVDSFHWLPSHQDLTASRNAFLYADQLDRIIWRGFEDRALPWLEALLERGPPKERAAASWALARWHMVNEDHVAAAEAIKVFHADCLGVRNTVPHAGPYLLGVEAFLALGESDCAARVLKAGIERFGLTPDFALGQIQLARAKGASPAQLSVMLAQVYANTGLEAVHLSEGSGALFDRLEASGGRTSASTAESLPLVSVIVPVFNGGEVLDRALAGLRGQSWSNLEILVVDDGSTDGSIEVAQAAAALDQRIRVIDLKHNQGAYAARNVGLAEARGEFVTVHDADDWSHPEKIERQAGALIEDPSRMASVSHWVRVGNALEMTLWRLDQSWIFRNVSSLMIRSSLRDQLGYWDRVKVNADTEYYYRIIRAFGSQSIAEVCPGIPLSFGRTLPQSLTSRSATHARTQFRGLRHDYMEAAHCWHAQADNPGELYMPQHPTVQPFLVPPEIDLGRGEQQSSAFERLTSSNWFDEEWYLFAYPDVMQSDIGAARHYLLTGSAENRDPGPLFSASGYRLKQGLGVKGNSLLHFLDNGQDPGMRLATFNGAIDPSKRDAGRVLVFAHTSGDALFGAERSFLDMVARLKWDGANPVVVLPGAGNAEYLRRLLEISVAVEVLPQVWRHGLRPPVQATIDGARDLIRKHCPTEVHVNTLVQEAPLLAARAEGVPSVVYVREMPAEDDALCRSLGMQAESVRIQLMEQADRFIMPSEVVAQWLGCPERCTVRPNAVDESLFELPFDPGAVLRVALVSSNIEKKGIKDVVEVARLVAATGWPVHFILIGPDTPDLSRLQPLPPNVLIGDYVKTPIEAMKQVDVVLSLSHFAESFGRTVVEGMAAGRPVICYDRGAPPALIVSGETGFVVPADDTKSVADAVLALNLARLQLEKMSVAARRRAREIQDQALA